MIYFTSCFGIAFVFQTFVLVAATTNRKFGTDLEYAFATIQIVLKFVSICIIIATAIIVVKKLCNKTLRENDESRASNGSPFDKYDNSLIEPTRISFKKFAEYDFIFRLAIIRLALLFFDLLQSFLGRCAELLSDTLFHTHNVDNIFMCLCERNLLWFIMEFANFSETFSYTNGIWILLFVITGPQFVEGLKNA